MISRRYVVWCVRETVSFRFVALFAEFLADRGGFCYCCVNYCRKHTKHVEFIGVLSCPLPRLRRALICCAVNGESSNVGDDTHHCHSSPARIHHGWMCFHEPGSWVQHSYTMYTSFMGLSPCSIRAHLFISPTGKYARPLNYS